MYIETSTIYIQQFCETAVQLKQQLQALDQPYGNLRQRFKNLKILVMRLLPQEGQTQSTSSSSQQ